MDLIGIISVQHRCVLFVWKLVILPEIVPPLQREAALRSVGRTLPAVEVRQGQPRVKARGKVRARVREHLQDVDPPKVMDAGYVVIPIIGAENVLTPNSNSHSNNHRKAVGLQGYLQTHFYQHYLMGQ